MILALLLQSALAGKIDAVLANPKLSGAVVACLVEDTEGHVLYAKNPETRLLPASNEKLLTCAFALWKLGPDYRCKLSVWKERDGITVAATGDPLLTIEALKQIQAKANPGRGPVRLWEAYRPGFHPTWELGDLGNRYSAPVTALTIDRAGLELWSVRGKLVLKPDLPSWHINYRPTNDPVEDRVNIFLRQIYVTGKLPKEDKRLDTLCLPEPDLSAAALLGRRTTVVDDIPKRKPDFEFNGSTFSDLLHICLQKSDNDIAENLLLMTGGATNIDVYDNAIAKLKTFLQTGVGIPPELANPFDGSGLSRRNFGTVKGLAQLLRWELGRPTKDLWLDALDRPGLGTLQSRMKGIDFRGKTGTLTGVSALSGYLTTNGKTYIVSFIANNFLVPSSEVKTIEDELIRTLSASL